MDKKIEITHSDLFDALSLYVNGGISRGRLIMTINALIAEKIAANGVRVYGFASPKQGSPMGWSEKVCNAVDTHTALLINIEPVKELAYADSELKPFIEALPKKTLRNPENI